MSEQGLEHEFRAIPIFRIFDPDKARAFYLDFLGMSVDWEHRFEDAAPLYMQVSRGSLTLHLSEHHGDCCPGSTVYVQTAGLEDYHREITATGYRFMRPGVEPAPWGEKIMEVIDPFGNRLRFCGPRTHGVNTWGQVLHSYISSPIASCRPTPKIVTNVVMQDLTLFISIYFDSVLKA